MSVEIFFIGENTIVPPKLQMGTDTPKFNFMYVRKINGGCIETSFSNDLEELKNRMLCELELA